jgi:hypothetical protein
MLEAKCSDPRFREFADDRAAAPRAIRSLKRVKDAAPGTCGGSWKLNLGRGTISDMLQPRRCAVCESEELTSYPMNFPDQLDRWNFLLADKVVYCCSNGHRFVILPDDSKRSQTLL